MAAALLGLCPLALSCAGGVSDAELEQAPIAAIYWSEEAARLKLDLEREGQRGPNKRGVARSEDLGELLGFRGDENTDSWSTRFPGHIGLVDPATGTVARLEVAPAGAVPLDWSLDHERLLYSARSTTGFWQLYAYDVRTQEVTQLTHDAHHHSRGAFGPSGRLAFTRSSGVRERALLVQDSVGEKPRLLFDGVYIERVSWSPGGDMLVVAVEELAPRPGASSASRLLFAISPDAPPQPWPPTEGSALKPLGRGAWPAYGTIGDWLVYSAEVGSASRLRLIRPETGARRALGNSLRDEVEASLSPDGTLVAYVAAENRIRRLFVRRMDGTGERMLVTDGMVAHPVW